MTQLLQDNQRVRKNFGIIDTVASIPNLIEIQKISYKNNFMQLGLSSKDRKNKGLQAVLSSVFPITDTSNVATLEFVKYEFDDPKYDIEECIQRGISFVAPLKVTLRLSVWDVDELTGAKEIKGIKEQEVYMGDVPFMTPNATFIINGTERVVVSQVHRSPGGFFYHDEGKTHSSGKFLYSARIIPYRGSWLDLEFDAKDIVYSRVDRKRKFKVTTLLMAIGMNPKEILEYYYDTEEYHFEKGSWVANFDPANIPENRLRFDLVNADNNEKLLESGQKLTKRLVKKFIDNGLKRILVQDSALVGSYLGKEIVDQDSGEVLVDLGDQITEDTLKGLVTAKIGSISTLKIHPNSDAYIRNTLFSDKNRDQESALIEIFRILRPGEPATVEAGQALFNSLFFDLARYDLSEVGRIKLNSRLGLDVAEDNTCLTQDDIKSIVKLLIDIKDGKGSIDDIDHLGNRRVRSVGELVENQCRIGLIRMTKSILERMGSVDIDAVVPHDLVNAKTLMSVIKDFFNTSQLSQFMDQTNPLSEITHKRRLSALGPGGVSRDRVGFEVRDVHPTHYGRICPIETPEGQNIGLINSMATYARVNKYGFIETPYRRVKDGIVTDEVVYLTAIDEGNYKIAQADMDIAPSGKIEAEMVNCRFETGNFVLVPANKVEFIDVTPMQVVSVAASLIPFLENDDANRALMGSNMQRQAVPLVTSDAPLVGTGIESTVARDSGAAIIALNDGIVVEVDAER
ncbi:DNA-directed RNA polymerase subunit beta, partial [Rickettsiaceae bacterium]|nr:DNA-directed RNA polymerase subunit beta [Rickettsiaceae bacterium]